MESLVVSEKTQTQTICTRNSDTLMCVFSFQNSIQQDLVMLFKPDGHEEETKTVCHHTHTPLIRLYTPHNTAASTSAEMKQLKGITHLHYDDMYCLSHIIFKHGMMYIYFTESICSNRHVTPKSQCWSDVHKPTIKQRGAYLSGGYDSRSGTGVVEGRSRGGTMGHTDPMNLMR